MPYYDIRPFTREIEVESWKRVLRMKEFVKIRRWQGEEEEWEFVVRGKRWFYNATAIVRFNVEGRIDRSRSYIRLIRYEPPNDNFEIMTPRYDKNGYTVGVKEHNEFFDIMEQNGCGSFITLSLWKQIMAIPPDEPFFRLINWLFSDKK
jgi:hypothetical protein